MCGAGLSTHQSQRRFLADQCAGILLGFLAQKRNGQMLAVASGDRAILVRTATHVYMAQEWDTILHATDHHVDPQRVKATALLVQNPCQPIEQGLRLHLNVVIVTIVVGHLLVDVFLDELEVGVVAAHSDYGVLVDLEHTVDVAETSQRSV